MGTVQFVCPLFMWFLKKVYFIWLREKHGEGITQEWVSLMLHVDIISLAFFQNGRLLDHSSDTVWDFHAIHLDWKKESKSKYTDLGKLKFTLNSNV